MQDHYQTLGVSATATQDEIKSAYRKLAMQHHPDRNAGSKDSEDKLKNLNEAYDILKDPVKRGNYDTQRKWSKSGFSDEFSKARTERTFRDDDMEQAVRDLYETLLKENMRRSSQYGSKDSYDYYGRKWSPYEAEPPKNPTVRVSIEVPLRSILEEQKRVINVNTMNQKFDVEITIPKGVRTGSVITYKGKGSTQIKNAPPGDLVIEIVVGIDPYFERVGDDLVSNIVIDALGLTVGTEFEFTSIDNRKIKINIPKGTQPGTTFRIAGHGLPIAATGKMGHQFVRVGVKVPTNLTDKQLDQIRAAMNSKV